ncbi:hypothetical protein [Shewanella baltica]|uniref:hypothetical protein n=1 Tax=Shewanella baltica TaxID=62322 RepID=UPI0002185AF4|nr:hypothetical protein [Shewanella baltica]AEH13146.1 hypothetical protein Sbal117_1384 [Shewanella baltica OS117]
MNFEIVKKTDLKTGIIFFEVLLDGVFKKRFGSRAEALRYIEQLEDEIKATVANELSAVLEDSIKSISTMTFNVQSDDLEDKQSDLKLKI